MSELSLLETIMARDGLERREAVEMIAEARRRVLIDGDDPEEVLAEDFGLEPDYLIDLIG